MKGLEGQEEDNENTAINSNAFKKKWGLHLHPMRKEAMCEKP